MGSVSSLRGGRYVLPAFKDRRGPSLRFDAALKDGARVSVEGYGAPLGLVLHRSLGDRAKGWTISEPRTGSRVVGGHTRQGALDALAQRVAFEGGEIAFEAALKIAISVSLEAAYWPTGNSNGSTTPPSQAGSRGADRSDAADGSEFSHERR